MVPILTTLFLFFGRVVPILVCNFVSLLWEGSPYFGFIWFYFGFWLLFSFWDGGPYFGNLVSLSGGWSLFSSTQQFISSTFAIGLTD